MRYSSAPSLRKARIAQAVDQLNPLDLRAPLPPEAMEEVRAEVEVISQEIEQDAEPEQRVPEFWSKGALLNVRNRGDAYIVTLYPEEFDPRHPERALTFPNTWTTQDFVSHWYSRETADPRAR